MAPLIAVNTAFRHEARIFTLFHECGHLITRTQSLCLESNHSGFGKPADKTERWCEEFAADVVLPRDMLRSFLSGSLEMQADATVTDLDPVYAIAKQFNVSARAATIALIHQGRASWDLYRQIPRVSDDKQRGFGRGGLTRGKRREGQLGKRTTRLFANAVRRGLLNRADAMSYLRVSDTELAEYWSEPRD
jgi:Zn-dependent peptidase ImmA (M78 family)